MCIPSNYLRIHILHLICPKSVRKHLFDRSQNSPHALGLSSEKQATWGEMKGT